MLARVIVRVHKWCWPVRQQLLVTVYGYASECKHVPTCSEYLLQETEKDGWQGMARGVKRLLKCI